MTGADTYVCIFKHRLEGFRGYYKGLNAYLIHVMPNICIVFLVYEKFSPTPDPPMIPAPSLPSVSTSRLNPDIIDQDEPHSQIISSTPVFESSKIKR